MTNQELMDQYADTLNRFNKTDCDDPKFNDLELECTRLEKIGAEQGCFAAMEQLLFDTMDFE